MMSSQTRTTFEPDGLWFTSDTHFWHENIIKYCDRPFRNAEEMNSELIRRWNETVPEDGIVFHLGDFCHGSPKQWNDILHSLHGKIFLILGNHDMKYYRGGDMSGFEYVTQQMTIRVGAQSIILNHNPFLCYGGSYRNVWQLFGHVHSGPFSHTGLDHPRLKILFPMQYDVGVDNNGFHPVSFAYVKQQIETQVAKARKASGIPEEKTASGVVRLVFTDQGTVFGQEERAELLKVCDDIFPLSIIEGESLKEAIGRTVSLFPSNVRYVYLGKGPLEDFRTVELHGNGGLSEADISVIKDLLG